VTDPFEKANKTNISNLCLQLRTISPFLSPSLFRSLPQFQITEQRVHNILSNCDSSKSPGPDSIHPFTLKATATEISPMLAHIFSQSLEAGSIRSDWKYAYVTPIFKKVQNLI